MPKKIIMLTGNSPSSVFMYNGLKDHFDIAKVFVEEKPCKRQFLKIRVKRLGLIKVFGQVLFQLIIPRLLAKQSKERIKEIETQYALDCTPIPDALLQDVDSVNGGACMDYLAKEKPDLVIVNGTRILSKTILNCSNALFLNTHAGITPAYRGVHGGYWAIANNDPTHCGVTVHLVDAGIDTGGVLYQKIIDPIEKDNFNTYTHLQIGEGIELMKKAISDFFEQKLKEIKPQSSTSKLWYHPTLWYYIYKRWTDGVK